jgi:YfiH family protein
LDSWNHGFFTQQFWSNSPAELTKILNVSARAYRVRQVHGNAVLAPSEIEAAIPTKGDEEPEHPPADGLMTEQAEQAVWVCSADCTPVLIGDVTTGNVAAVHAGWRGTAMKIVPEAIARLRSQGSQLQDLRIALGPAIAGEVYQVSEHVAAQVGATVVPTSPENIAATLDAVRQLPDAPVQDDPEPGRIRLDVRRVNALQLEQLGISPEQIAVSTHCTYQNPNHFFSYRRDRQKKAQWSGIVSR